MGGLKTFILRGNVIDLAVGFIIGAAFAKIVSSLVNDIIMPPIGLALGKVDFSNLYLNLSGASFTTLADAKKAGAVTINYGLFLNTIFEFLIVALVLYVLIQQISRLTTKPAPVAAPTTKECQFCFSTIALKATRCPNCTSQI
ncbi:MAG: large conductance mechanosensitive channel protein MscL [Chloroflexi bacterium]|nr:large conductance mechanosensitive channel protein MscL [Chloroflexota bacterium]